MSNNHCVACKDIICTTDKSCVKADLSERIVANQKLIKEHTDFIVRCKEQILMREQMIEKYNADMLKYEKRVSYERQLAGIKLPELPEKPEKPIHTDYTDKKLQINQKLSIIMQYDIAMKNKIEADVLKEEISLLEMAVAVFDVKKGIRTVILQRALKTFETLCNAKLRSLNNNMEISFKADDGIEIFVKTENSNGYVPMNKVSTGQFVLVSFVLMCLFGNVTKCSYCIIDNLDKLDKESAKRFLDLVNTDDTFDTVIMAGVSHGDLLKVCEDYIIIHL